MSSSELQVCKSCVIVIAGKVVITIRTAELSEKPAHGRINRPFLFDIAYEGVRNRVRLADFPRQPPQPLSVAPRDAAAGRPEPGGTAARWLRGPGGAQPEGAAALVAQDRADRRCRSRISARSSTRI